MNRSASAMCRRASGTALAAALLTAAAITARAEGMLGVLTPQLESELEPGITGQLIAVHVRIGDVVETGALIAELDPEQITRDLEEAEARLEAIIAEQEAADARLRMAEDLLGRQRTLIEQQAVSQEAVRGAQQDVELAGAELNQARASVRQQQAAVEQHRARLRQTRITAPFAGTVAERYGNPGTTVGPGRAVVRLISTDSLRARFAAPVEQARHLALGKALRVVLADIDQELKGTIRQIGSEVDPASGMIICEAAVEWPDDWSGPPLSGQTVRVWLASE